MATVPADYNARLDELVSRLSRVGCPTNSQQVRNLILVTGTTATTLLGPGAEPSEWFDGAMAELGRLVEILGSSSSIVSLDQLAEYALRAGKKLSEMRDFSPEQLAGLVSEQIERIHRPDKDRSAHLLQLNP